MMRDESRGLAAGLAGVNLTVLVAHNLRYRHVDGMVTKLCRGLGGPN